MSKPAAVSGGPTWFERLLFGSISSGHLSTFCRQFASYLDSGVDIFKALSALEAQFARTALGPVLGRLQLATRRGDALADAMAHEPQVFDPLFLSMLRVAEARGGIPETLRSLSKHYETRQRLIRQARSAMIYPAAVLIIATAVGALLTFFVLPALVGLMEDNTRNKAVTLPLPTRMLIDFSHFVRDLGWWLLPLLFFGLLFGLIYAYKTPGGKRVLDEGCLYVPVLGKLMRKIDTTRFARTMSALLDAGIAPERSLDLTADVLQLSPFRRAVQQMRGAVKDGTELGEALQTTGRFGPDVLAVVETGEETGSLPEALARLADSYEEQVAFMVKNLGSLIVPVIVVGLGGIVLFIALAFVMAYVAMIQNLGAPGAM